MGKTNHRDDPFSRMMFGDRREGEQGNHHSTPESNPSTFDIDSLVDNLSKLRDSTKNLKPLIQMVYPFVEGFLKKK